ncbi:hypothetical protein M407DRAFT_8013 [Tulasnella calospora MUT 4182]|uniref:Uncharacterized protein n=1 Tax=Tulasnella calospora MUT 4182 TaxID=1051891 RepID=A0A0C3Q8I5_9AGAM|nr:hypothetical protein M407DRAFT_8013 [Tulasnella calospora MUT 4182]
MPHPSRQRHKWRFKERGSVVPNRDRPTVGALFARLLIIIILLAGTKSFSTVVRPRTSKVKAQINWFREVNYVKACSSGTQRFNGVTKIKIHSFTWFTSCMVESEAATDRLCNKKKRSLRTTFAFAKQAHIVGHARTHTPATERGEMGNRTAIRHLGVPSFSVSFDGEPNGQGRESEMVVGQSQGYATRGGRLGGHAEVPMLASAKT